MSYFYAHLVNPDDITKHMELLEMTDAERNHLIMIIQSTLHHKVIDLILEELHDDHKHVFLKHIVEENHEEVWELLNAHIERPEDKIRAAIEALTTELREDLKGSGE